MKNVQRGSQGFLASTATAKGRRAMWAAGCLLGLGCAPEASRPFTPDMLGADEPEVQAATEDAEDGDGVPAMLLRQSVFDSVTGTLANGRYLPFDRARNLIAFDKAGEFLPRADLAELPREGDLPAVTAYTAYNLPNATRTAVERIWVATPSGAYEQYSRRHGDDSAADDEWLFVESGDVATTAASALALSDGHTNLYAWRGDTSHVTLLNAQGDVVGSLADVNIEGVNDLTPLVEDVGALRSQSDIQVSAEPREQTKICASNVNGQCDYDFQSDIYICPLTTNGVLTQAWWREETDSNTEDTIIGFYRNVPVVDGDVEWDCASRVTTVSQSAIAPLGLDDVTGQGTYVAAYNPDVPSPSRYVALGDSYSSGAGLFPYTAVDRTPDPSDDECQRSGASWPEMIATAIGAVASTDSLDDDYSNSTCGGAKTSDILDSGQWPGMLPQIENITSDTDVVTLSIGGNDLGFAPLLKGCVLGGNYPGSNPDCRTYIAPAPEGGQERTFAEELDWRLAILGGDTTHQYDVLVDPDDPSRVIQPISDVLEAILDEAGPSTKIRVVGVPRILSGESISATSSCLIGLTGDEAVWIDDIASRLNLILADAVSEAVNHAANHSPNGGVIDIRFVDPTPAFSGHGACVPDVGQRWINLVDIDTQGADWAPWKWAHDGTLHPSAEGAFQIGKLVLESL